MRLNVLAMRLLTS